MLQEGQLSVHCVFCLTKDNYQEKGRAVNLLANVIAKARE